jgi:hypothetical protein
MTIPLTSRSRALPVAQLDLVPHDPAADVLRYRPAQRNPITLHDGLHPLFPGRASGPTHFRPVASVWPGPDPRPRLDLVPDIDVDVDVDIDIGIGSRCYLDQLLLLLLLVTVGIRIRIPILIRVDPFRPTIVCHVVRCRPPPHRPILHHRPILTHRRPCRRLGPNPGRSARRAARDPRGPAQSGIGIRRKRHTPPPSLCVRRGSLERDYRAASGVDRRDAVDTVVTPQREDKAETMDDAPGRGDVATA